MCCAYLHCFTGAGEPFFSLLLLLCESTCTYCTFSRGGSPHQNVLPDYGCKFKATKSYDVNAHTSQLNRPVTT